MINSTILLLKKGKKNPLPPIHPLEGWRQGKLEFKVKKYLYLSCFKGEFLNLNQREIEFFLNE